MFDKLPYAELHAYSAYTFGHGVAQVDDMVKSAQNNGIQALCLTERNGLYTAVQLSQAAQRYNYNVIYGAELRLGQVLDQPAGAYLPILARGRKGYTQLSSTISHHNLSHKKRTTPAYCLEELGPGNAWYVLTGNHNGPLLRPFYKRLLAGKMTEEDEVAAYRRLQALCRHFGADNVVIENCLYGFNGEEHQIAFLTTLAERSGCDIVVTSGANCAHPSQQALADVVLSTYYNRSLGSIEYLLPAHHALLPTPTRLRDLYERLGSQVTKTCDIAQQCYGDPFHRPQLPHAPTPPGYSESQWLRQRTYEGALHRYGSRSDNAKAWKQIDKELQVIDELGFCGYFLIVDDIVQFCRKNDILCQGRGSAANSAVCYALGITAVDAVRHKMMFERFLSAGRTTPPDIDVDIESGRREEVIQYVYQRYGRTKAALVGTVISYRQRSALRDVTMALGIDLTQPHNRDTWPPIVDNLVTQMRDLPQHMGIHPGGMVLSREPVTNICPVFWGATQNRSVLQWDKDDCAQAGLVKFDLLGLGMLSALHSAFDFLAARGIKAPNGRPLDLYSIPDDDEKVYDLLQRADTVGVFQVESRAQMNTLPRIKPQCFYDIVVEVALIRPGPIQGNAVNPYIKRRRGYEPVTYVHPLLKNALEKTLGVPLFQEQLMKIAVDVAGYDPSQADALRKAMSSKRSKENMEALYPTLMEGMKEKGLSQAQAEEVWTMLIGFAQFGFPESHAFSFAYIVYASAWLKVHYPAEFYAAILANQPMGFYSPQSLVADARRHEVKVHRPDINRSGPKASVIDGEVQLGFDAVRSLHRSTSEKICYERETFGRFTSMNDFISRVDISREQRRLLARANAFASVESSRPHALWDAGKPKPRQLAFDFDIDTPIDLPEENTYEGAIRDIVATGVSTSSYPTQFVRPPDTTPACRIGEKINNQRICVIGVITHRQRPRTAKGVTFLSLEDETGLINVICHQHVWDKYKDDALHARGIMIWGRVQSRDGATAVLATHMQRIDIAGAATSRDFR